MRVLITGAGGLLGGRLAERLAETFEIVAAWRDSAPPPNLASIRLDLGDYAEVERQIVQLRIDAVVHCAALADPDRCEHEPELARRLNVDLSRTIAHICRARGLRLVALSTDLAFDGCAAPYDECRSAEPALVYGRTKLAGEQAVLEEHPGAAVARVALVVGCGHGRRGTASESIAWRLRAGQPLRLFSDQFRTPVDSDSVADALARLLRAPHAGRFHVGGTERVSRLELGLRVALALGLPTGSIVAVRQSDAPVSAPRPADVSLLTTRTQSDLGWQPRTLDQAIRDGRPAPP